jgi:hypothetical protein
VRLKQAIDGAGCSMKYVVVDYKQRDYYGCDGVYVASFDTRAEAERYILDEYTGIDRLNVFIKRVDA